MSLVYHKQSILSTVIKQTNAFCTKKASPFGEAQSEDKRVLPRGRTLFNMKLRKKKSETKRKRKRKPKKRENCREVSLFCGE